MGSFLRMPTWQLACLLVYPMILGRSLRTHCDLPLPLQAFSCTQLSCSVVLPCQIWKVHYSSHLFYPTLPPLRFCQNIFWCLQRDPSTESWVAETSNWVFKKNFYRPVSSLPLFFQLLDSTFLISSSWGANVQPQEITLWFICHPSDKHSSTSQDCVGWVLPGSEHFPKSWFDYPKYLRVQNQILFLKCS